MLPSVTATADPVGLSLPENSLAVLRRRYLRKGPDGKPMETVPEMFWRVASNVALPERAYEGEERYLETAEEFYDLLNTLRFFPNSPTFTGAGTPLGQLAACFVLAIDDDMGKDSSEGIFNTLRNAALIQQNVVLLLHVAIAEHGELPELPHLHLYRFIVIFDHPLDEAKSPLARRGARIRCP